MLRLFLAALIALLPSLPAAAKPRFEWPAGKTSAIVLTYDDSLVSQLDVAAPQLDAAGFRGTFFLNGTFASVLLPRWAALAANGHELGNHTIFHPCPAGSFKMDPQFESERYTIPGMLREIGVMNTLLQSIDGKTQRTMGLPCLIALAGGKDYTDALRTSGLIRYVRAGGETFASDPATLDPFRVPSRTFPETVTAEDMIGFVKQVQANGGMGVILFHGVGGDYLVTSAAAHQGLLNYLKAHPEIWVAPFQTVMDQATRARP
jgi:peptidoglycan/xylan/chitin deacetylase (PgdA/CDA1 family)